MSRCGFVWIHFIWDRLFFLYLYTCFFRFKNFLALISSNTFFISFSLISPSGTPIMHRLAHFSLSYRSHILLFFSFVFLSTVLIGWCPLFYLSNHFFILLCHLVSYLLLLDCFLSQYLTYLLFVLSIFYWFVFMVFNSLLQWSAFLSIIFPN